MVRARKIINKQHTKRLARQCRFCGETDYSTLSVHRIKPGKDGGRYTIDNVVVCCSNCHRKIHDNQISILKWRNSTGGRVLQVIIDGEETFI